MSSASPFRKSAPELPSLGNAQRIRSLAVDSVQFAGFWSAVAIPFALFALIASGAAVQQAPLFVGLVAANLVALRLGHGYNQ